MICRQLEGYLHMITFDYRTALNLYSSISFWLERNWANKLNVTDHFHSFWAAKVDFNPANVEAEDS